MAAHIKHRQCFNRGQCKDKSHYIKFPKMSGVICPIQVQVMRWSDAKILPPESELSV